MSFKTGDKVVITKHCDVKGRIGTIGMIECKSYGENIKGIFNNYTIILTGCDPSKTIFKDSDFIKINECDNSNVLEVKHSTLEETIWIVEKYLSEAEIKRIVERALLDESKDYLENKIQGYGMGSRDFFNAVKSDIVKNYMESRDSAAMFKYLDGLFQLEIQKINNSNDDEGNLVSSIMYEFSCIAKNYIKENNKMIEDLLRETILNTVKEITVEKTKSMIGYEIKKIIDTKILDPLNSTQ